MAKMYPGMNSKEQESGAPNEGSCLPSSGGKSLDKAGIKCEEAELAMVPKSLVETSDEDANSNIALIEYIESLDDVDTVYHNMKI